MSRFEIATAASFEPLTGRAREWLRAQAADRPVLLLSGSARAAEDLLYPLAESGLAGVHRFTLRQLVATLAAIPLAEAGLAPVSSLGARAVIARVLQMETADEAIPYFAPVARTPGFPTALQNTLEEVRLAGLSPNDLSAAGAPGQDLARLLSGFGARLREARLADYAQVLALASSAIATGSHPFSGFPVLLLDVSADSIAERDFLRALFDRAPFVCAAVLAGDEERRAWLESVLATKARPFKSPAGADIETIRQGIFQPESTGAPAGDGTFAFFSAANETLECVEIARRMHAAARAELPFDGMAVLLRHPGRYQPVLEEALRRASVPAWFSRGVLRPNPAGRAFLTLLECAAEGCSATRFAEYLSLAQVPRETAEGKTLAAAAGWVPAEDELLNPAVEPAAEATEDEAPAPAEQAAVNPRTWERLLEEASVIGGRDRWARRLAGLEAEYRLRLEEAEEGDPPYEFLAHRLECLAQLQRFVLPLVDLLDGLPGAASWGEWLAQLNVVARRALRHPEPVLAVLAELKPMADVGPASIHEVVSVLESRLNSLRREPAGRPFGKVFVGSIEEARGRSFSLVFLPGLAEGQFPARTLEDPLLLGIWRESLPGNLVRQHHRAQRERLLLRIALAAAGRLVASYPRTETAQSRARVPSFYALELVRAAEGRLPDLRDFEKRAARQSEARLGWPAPTDPEQAIDYAEYDLAYLDQVLDRAAGQAKGVARYLMEVNPILARSLRSRYLRWESKWSTADGLVHLSPEMAEALQEYRLTQKDYSASALQHFTACPYRFLLAGIHRLRPRESLAPLERMDPLTRGSLFHEVQFRFFNEVRRSKLALVPERLAELSALADRFAGETSADFAERLAPLIPRVWQNEVESLKADLRGWIRDLVQTAQTWRPFRNEFSFGLPLTAEHDPASTPDAVELSGGYRLRGAIDLIEERPDGGLRVTDHKTGRAPASLPVFTGGGRLLQPLLYALAAESVLGRTVHSGRLYYCTQRGGYSSAEIVVNGLSREKLRGVLEFIDGWLAAGFLPAAPAAGECERCDYHSVCGPYEEVRVRRKDQRSLDALEALRKEG